ncbi:MAG: hypothetical protein KIB43_07720 [Clostridium baratii]|uniref:Uncharacterized protein n=1 Tax=Clostridium baratii str. Sullivan TaxID=1415775 RepID=A0A0A7FU08_9CLOT|nr:hypothetical protein [Clostridium baratii]AIY83073.1 hypothetical protein U729_2705 [Clostridium baratii str. Sullivan]MBS6006835.1 hypothetical protein [Clostridium baratii]MDU1053492.1 hypothetical protein [Clostridium baratii]MDU4910465.1 hypothetical protein [Clostridium baratii]CUP02937.1 Uncharacterised protein [Clostridium baratii]
MYKKYIQSIIEIDYLEKIEDYNEFIYCKFCNSKIDDNYYIDQYNLDIYCSIECYTNKIENDYK